MLLALCPAHPVSCIFSFSAPSQPFNCNSVILRLRASLYANYFSSILPVCSQSRRDDRATKERLSSYSDSTSVRTSSLARHALHKPDRCLLWQQSLGVSAPQTPNLHSSGYSLRAPAEVPPPSPWSSVLLSPALRGLPAFSRTRYTLHGCLSC